MIREWCFRDTIQTEKKDDIRNCVEEFLATAKGSTIVTIIATTDSEDVWSEVELENKERVLEWIDEVNELCTIKMIHLSTKYGLNKTWRVG